jgi:hypothetical protein
MHGRVRKIQIVKLLPPTTVKTLQFSIHVNIYAGLDIPLCTAWNSPEVLVTITYMGAILISNDNHFSDFLCKNWMYQALEIIFHLTIHVLQVSYIMTVLLTVLAKI